MVKRWHIDSAKTAWVYPWDSGRFVEHSDYAALEQRNAELEAALKLLLCHSHCSEHQRLIIYRALEKKATP